MINLRTVTAGAKCCIVSLHAVM